VVSIAKFFLFRLSKYWVNEMHNLVSKQPWQPMAELLQLIHKEALTFKEIVTYHFVYFTKKPLGPIWETKSALNQYQLIPYQLETLEEIRLSTSIKHGSLGCKTVFKDEENLKLALFSVVSVCVENSHGEV
jgi:hypothetical protein